MNKTAGKMINWLCSPSPRRTTTMKIRRTERRISLLAALLGATAVSACSLGTGMLSDEAEGTAFSSAAVGTSVGAGGTASTSGGAGGTEQDSSIVLQPDGEAPPSNPHAGLCGEGSCVIGDDTGCNEGDAQQPQSCQLIPAMGTAMAQCGAAGGFKENEVCQTSEDCLPGLGCVLTDPMMDSKYGLCRPYCCGDPNLCPSSTYCAPQAMAGDMVNESPAMIPVCVPIAQCELLSPTPNCDPGYMCSIVKADGTTSCIKAGDGELGDACPCADGYVCSMLTGECKKLCKIGQDELYCGSTATCQAGIAGYQEGIGTCVGGENP
jgi:hypothetical protein